MSLIFYIGAITKFSLEVIMRDFSRVLQFLSSITSNPQTAELWDEQKFEIERRSLAVYLPPRQLMTENFSTVLAPDLFVITVVMGWR